MKQGNVIDLTQEISIQTEKFSLEKKVPMADSIIYATGRLYNATVWTQSDSGLKNLLASGCSFEIGSAGICFGVCVAHAGVMFDKYL